MPAAKDLDGERLVQVVGRQDVHGVEVAAGQPLFQRAEHLGAGFGGDLLGLFAVGVNGRCDLDAGGMFFDAVQVIRSDGAAPDKGQLECLGHVYPPSAISKRSLPVSLTL